jgi:menaquinone-dependent protoporphyrinogen oxidase
MIPTHISRRDFLKAAGVTLGAATLTCSGLAMLDQPEPPASFPQIKLGDPRMPNKLLVAYASRLGSTVGVAEAMGKTLAETGAQVDVLSMQDVNDLAPYRAVVCGSAVRDRQWLPEAVQFVQAHRAELRQKPFAAFLVCMTLAMPGAEKYRQGVSEWLQPVRALVRPVIEGLFAGVLDIGKIPSWSDRLKFRLSVAPGVWTEGDHRDWKAIRAWAESLPPLLGNAPNG